MSTRLERLLSMEEEIRRGRYPNVDTFCEMFEVKTRTVYEDIRSLKERMGLDIAYDRFRNGYYNRNPGKVLPPFELTNGEVFALTIGKEMLASYTGTSFEPILRAALEKIYDRLPGRVEVNIDDLRSMIRFKPLAVIPLQRKLFLDLNRACEKTQPIEIQYYAPSTNETTDRKVDPYRLVEHHGTWYLIGWCHLRNALRIFALHRIRECRILDARFTPIDDSEIDGWLKSAFMIEHRDSKHQVKIAFSATAARYIRERNWHESQKITECEDGSCILEMTAQSLDEIQRWMLSFGADAEALEPVELRNSMRNCLEAACKKYQAVSLKDESGQ